MAIFRGWVEFLKLGIPGSLSLAMEWGSWEVNALIVAQLPHTTIELAAHSVIANTAGLWYTIPNSIANALLTCVGNSLGAKNTYSTIVYAKLTFVIVLAYSILNGFAGILYSEQWGKLWTDDPTVAGLISDCMWILSVYGIVDVAKCVGGAIVRGCGHPSFNLGIYLLSTIFVGYPLSYVMGFVLEYRLIGIWMGMTMAWLVSSVAYAIIILRTDWNKEVQDAISRNEKTEQSIKNYSYDPLASDNTINLSPVESFIDQTNETV